MEKSLYFCTENIYNINHQILNIMTTKAINYFILRAIVAALLGVILIFCPENAIFYIVMTIGILFIIPALISLIRYFTYKRENRPAMPFLIAGVGCLLFGVVLVSMPNFFVSVLMILLGIILLLGSIEQFYTLIRAAKITKVPAYFYIVPSLILLAGVLVLFNPFATAKTLLILIGATCLIYGIMEFVFWVKFYRNYNKNTIAL